MTKEILEKEVEKIKMINDVLVVTVKQPLSPDGRNYIMKLLKDVFGEDQKIIVTDPDVDIHKVPTIKIDIKQMAKEIAEEDPNIRLTHFYMRLLQRFVDEFNRQLTSETE